MLLRHAETDTYTRACVRTCVCVCVRARKCVCALARGLKQITNLLGRHVERNSSQIDLAVLVRAGHNAKQSCDGKYKQTNKQISSFNHSRAFKYSSDGTGV